jgi:hypothetical protein
MNDKRKCAVGCFAVDVIFTGIFGQDLAELRDFR